MGSNPGYFLKSSLLKHLQDCTVYLVLIFTIVFFRDDKRQQMLKKDLEDANVVVQDMELELHKKSSDLDSAKSEIESLQTVKQSLKTKLKECKRYHSYIT